MNCLDRIALTEYMRGTMEPEELLAASEHIFKCAHCKSALKKLESYQPSAAYVRDAAFGVTECPEYEELSAYVDGLLADARLASIESHTTQCDLCTSDVATIRALRARAELAGPVVAVPVKFRRGFSLSLFPAWQKAAAVVALSAVIVGAVYLAKPAPLPNMASNPVSGKPDVVSTAPAPNAGGPGSTAKPGNNIPVENSSQKPGRDVIATAPGTGPAVSTEDKTGSQKPAAGQKPQLGGTVNLADLRLDPSIEAKLRQAIDQKLKSGSTSADKPVMVALADTGDRLRGSSNAVSELAPKPAYPSVGVMKSSPSILRWRPVEQAVTYRVTIRDEEGRTVANQMVEGNQLALSEALEPGKVYKWNVAANFGPGSDWKQSKAVAFRIMSADEYEAVRKAEAKFASRPEVLGTVYESFGLYDDAVKQFKKYAAAHPSELSNRMLSEARTKLASLE